MLLYDTVEDAKAKLASTLCYYDKDAVQVRDVLLSEDGEKKILVCLQSRKWKSYKYVPISDPKFRFNRYNLGYAQHKVVAIWWVRLPHKQWKQGLRPDQMQSFCAQTSLREYARFGFDNPVIDMMENIYPSAEECLKVVKDERANSATFHKDFAVSWDRLHGDAIIEYRGKNVGTSHDMKKFTLMPEYKYVNEAMLEALKL